jgi:hypothetical protein
MILDETTEVSIKETEEQLQLARMVFKDGPLVIEDDSL